MENKPVFIGGCDRSGTTMLGALLGSHSGVVCVPEAQFIIDIYRKMPESSLPIHPQKVVTEVERHPRFKVWDLQLDRSKFSLEENMPYAEIIEGVVSQYAKLEKKVYQGVWVDHVPANSMHFRTLHQLFPRAKFVHLVRDGRAVAASLLAVRWGPNTIDQAALFWARQLSYGLAAETFMGHELVKRVIYEDLVLNSGPTLADLCEFIGIEFQDEMVSGKGFSVPEYTKENHQLVGKPPSSARVNAWQKELSHRQIEVFEHLTGDLLDFLGYRLVFNGKTSGMTMAEKLASIVKAPLKYVNNYLQMFRLRIIGRQKGKHGS